LKANVAAARDLPRQLRLRGLGGQVTVDFAPVPKRDRAALDQQIRQAFRGEAAETSLAGWTPLGNFELQRKRDRLPLALILKGGVA
ncbi:MAG: ribonuclease E/G, partial [Albidovulum sp.]